MPLATCRQIKNKAPEMELFSFYYLHVGLFSIYLCKLKNMTKIIVKEIDRYYSRKIGKEYISEYLIYTNIHGANIECKIVLGESEKSLTVNEFIINNFNPIPKNFNEISNHIEEITIYKN